MLGKWSKIIYIAPIVLTTVLSGCGNSINPLDVGKALGHAENSLRKQRLVVQGASAYNPDEKLIKFRLVVKNTIANNDAQTLVNDFLKDAASVTQNNDPTLLFKPYNIEFAIVNSSPNGSILFAGYKLANSTAIEWQ